MRSLSLALLLGAAADAGPPVERVPLGAFRTWLPKPARALHLVANGVRLDVAAAPCSTPPDTEGCRFDGVNNQAAIVVTAPGLASFRVTSDPQASAVRVALVRIGARDARPGVVIDSQWGGSAGITTVSVIEPVEGGFREIGRDSGGRPIEGEVADHPVDLNGDGRIDLVLRDGGFGDAFGCNACTPRPPLIVSPIDGRLTDISRDPALRPIFARDLPVVRARCRSRLPERNGSCVAYLADAARIDRFAAAWRDMLAHYDPQARDLWQACRAVRDWHGWGGCPDASRTHYRSFPESARAFLVDRGYISAAQAAAAPLA